MAGLIQQSMTGAGPQPAAPAQDAAMRPMPEAMEREDESTGDDPESDAGYTQAMTFAMEALYANKAADQISESLKGAPDLVEGLANTAYDVVSIVDERTDGAVPDELLVLFASRILEEVAEIAEAAGIQVKPSDVALALKQMILRFLGEQGVDTTQLQQAMDQVDPEEFNRMAAEG